MGKKVGILTLNGYINYGNRLQNYALQKVISDLGFCVETLIISKPSKASNRTIWQKINTISIDKLIKKYRVYRYGIEENRNRKKHFIEFTRQYINEVDYGITKDYIPNDLNGKYDFFVCGSDQVWNPNYKYDELGIYFMTFAPLRKRITYAASLGIPEIPHELIEKYKYYFMQLYGISVREEVLAKLIKELTNKEAEVLVDPTMLLTKEQWIEIAKPCRNKPHKYILIYCLGTLPQEVIDFINQILKNEKLEIVNLYDRSQPFYLSGPSEFIDLVAGASLFFTDSFHGTVFSILLDTPFIVFERDNLNAFTRLDTLLEKFELQDRKFTEIIKVNDLDRVFTLDITHVDSILEEERNRAINYLRKMLDIDNNHEN